MVTHKFVIKKQHKQLTEKRVKHSVMIDILDEEMDIEDSICDYKTC